ncbi:MAG: UDP-3-O-(3-hydroxymyristoyl)glucosamine N-acyltransferase [Beijerinckiaceae bacterium]|nr:UDP-3-O-(3-hydroxymyristoyl)glucosamine N-acyltransferase [Beijerinckiaceae bacterium]
MSDQIAFFDPPPALSLRQIIELTGAAASSDVNLDDVVHSVAPLDRAGPTDLSFLENSKYGDQARATQARACLVAEKFAANLPPLTTALISKDPYRSLALVAGVMYPKAMRPSSIFGAQGVSPGSFVHPQARLEAGVVVDPGAVIGAGAEIGKGTVIAANAVIGPNVRIGRDCYIGPAAKIVHSLIGNRVLLHGGVALGHDGFGFAMSAKGHLKVPQIGRVVIQDDVEIGANSCVDRGSNRDTIIGEGTKIDNLVQIGHNVTIGRHCVLASMVGVSGSTVVEDFVVLGGQVGVTGHVRVGAGSQIAGSSDIMTDVPRGSRWGGTPARPIKQWFREIATLKNIVKKGKPSAEDPSETLA